MNRVKDALAILKHVSASTFIPNHTEQRLLRPVCRRVVRHLHVLKVGLP